MKRMFVLLTLITVLGVVGCSRPAATPTRPARPETLPTVTPTPTMPALTSPLTSPLPPNRRPMQVEVPTGAEKAVAAAVADLAERLGIKADQVAVIAAESVEWRDASLGCPQPGMMYAQVITPGYLIVLEAGGTQYPYHAGRSGETALFCPNGEKPLTHATQ